MVRYSAIASSVIITEMLLVRTDNLTPAFATFLEVSFFLLLLKVREELKRLNL